MIGLSRFTVDCTLVLSFLDVFLNTLLLQGGVDRFPRQQLFPALLVAVVVLMAYVP